MPSRDRPRLHVGTAGWTLPRAVADRFPGDGTHLERYARVFSAVEINSSFHRPHRPSTYARWAASVPRGFCFSVKLPKEVTHVQRLVGCDDALGRFFDEVGHLGDGLAVLLVQLPPSLALERSVARAFFAGLSRRSRAALACEPRHPSWFTPDAGRLLAQLKVARVAADPARVPEASRPGGWDGLVYHRLHGSPRMYYSAYEPPFLAALAAQLAHREAPTFCMFDNTTLGAATANALSLLEEAAVSGSWCRGDCSRRARP